VDRQLFPVARSNAEIAIHAIDLNLSGPTDAGETEWRASPSRSPTAAAVIFSHGISEGRIAWIAISAFDLATEGAADPTIRSGTHIDRCWPIDQRGHGGAVLSTVRMEGSAGSPDPYAYQFKAVATLGDDCPTLELVYAAPRNLMTNAKGLPIDARGVVIDKQKSSRRASLPRPERKWRSLR